MDGLASQGGPLSCNIWPGAVAVSGGGDSLALMHLLADWARGRKLPPPIVLCVDHGLRKESAKDARQVAAFAKAAGLKAHILAARGAPPKADIEAEARNLRFNLMGDWLKRHRIGALYVGHTEDDQAETFLLRLARGSGLDGLSAMRLLSPFPVAKFDGHVVVRPMLGIGRGPLRDWLAASGRTWLDDPMNGDVRFARTRIRKLAGQLAEAGLTPARIADAAGHLARAREALDLVTGAVLARATKPHIPKSGGQALLLDPLALAAAPREVGLRALAGLLMGLSGQEYRPRFEALERLFDRLASGNLGGGATLSGCRVAPAPRRLQDFGPQTLVLSRESSRRRG